MKSLALCLLIFIAVCAQKARFDNYQVQRLIPTNAGQLEAVRELELTGEFDFWTRPGCINETVDILVSPQKQPEFQEFVAANKILQKCQIKNIQSLIDEEETRLKSRCKDMDWSNYHKLDEIYEWMNEVSKKYPSAKKICAGKSREGRKINGLEISFQKNATAVFIESGMHGREWIGPAATSWMVKQILDSSSDSVFRNFTYFYFPVFNPDGYSYSWTHNRLWKKTRTPYKVGSLICYGADPNKNWDFLWNEVGSSSNPCSEDYAGPSPFSEVEMKSISSYLKGIATSRNVDIYIAYHSYSQRLLYPWDHQLFPAPHRDFWQRIGEPAIADLKAVHGTDFELGNSCQFLGPATGSSGQWYYGLFNASISFLYELRDKGLYGFIFPPEQIIPSGEELLASLERILIDYQNITKWLK